MKPVYNTNIASLKGYFISLMLIIAGGFSVNAQQIAINSGSSLVLNGSVSLVINNASFKNNGTFAAGASTVVFAGNNDTTSSYVGGNTASVFNNLSVIKSAYGVALKSGSTVTNVLTVNGGNLFTYGNLTLKSDASLTARVAPVAATSHIIGNANVERYIPSKRAWRLLTAPVTGAFTILSTWQNGGSDVAGRGMLVTGTNASGAEGNGLDLSAQNSQTMKTWVASAQNWLAVGNTKVPISAGISGSADNTPYFVFVRGDRNPGNTCTCATNNTTLNSTGSLQTGTQTFPVTSTAGKYSLIGNPYASPVNFDNIGLNNVIKRFYVWDPSLNFTGGYVEMDDMDGTGNYLQSTASSQTVDIQSGQAFFVQTDILNTPASVTFNESSKSANRSNVGFRPMGVPSGLLRTTLNLLNADNTTTLADGVFAQFNNKFSSVVDRNDALKFGNTNENLSIVRNTTSLTAERRPELTINDTIYFKLTTTTQRAYQFVFTASNMQTNLIGYLVDSYLGTSKMISLDGTTTINFSINAAAASAATNRFKIVFKTAAVLPVTFTSVKAYNKNAGIEVEWNVENEINMVKYDVEKSTDGSTFTYAGTTAVSRSNSSNNTYSWLDVKPIQGVNYYRIKSYDQNGEVKYSIIVKAVIAASASSYSIYPNPVTTNVINLVMTNQPAGKYHVQLTNAIGQVIFVKDIQINGGNSTQGLSTGSKLIAGVYQLEISGQDNNHDTQKVIVE
jgi:hypothetical protein